MLSVSWSSEFGWRRLLAPIALLALLGGCDPGFDYRPVDWQPANERPGWQKDFDGFRVRISHLAGLAGSRSVVPEFEVTNLTTTSLVLETAALRAGAREYEGTLPRQGEARWRTVDPGASRHIGVSWQLEAPVLDALGEQPSVTLVFRVGERRVPVEVSYRRHQ